MDKSLTFSSNEISISKSELTYYFTYYPLRDEIDATALNRETKERYRCIINSPIIFTKNDEFKFPLKPKGFFGLLSEYANGGIKSSRGVIITIPEKPQLGLISINILVKLQVDTEVCNDVDIDFEKQPLSASARHEIILKEQRNEIKELKDVVLKLTSLVEDLTSRLEKVENGSRVYVHTDRLEKVENTIYRDHNWCNRAELSQVLTSYCRKGDLKVEVSEEVEKYKDELVKATISSFLETPPVTQQSLNQVLQPLITQLAEITTKPATIYYSKQEIDNKFAQLFHSISQATHLGLQ